MLRKSKTLAMRARLERSAPEVQVYWRRSETVTQFRFFVSRGPESKVSVRLAQTRSLSRARGAFVAWHLGNSYSLAIQAKEAFHTETPNPSIERTRSGSAGLAFISFWAKPVMPLLAAHVKR